MVRNGREDQIGSSLALAQSFALSWTEGYRSLTDDDRSCDEAESVSRSWNGRSGCQVSRHSSKPSLPLQGVEFVLNCRYVWGQESVDKLAEFGLKDIEFKSYPGTLSLA